MTFEPDLRGWFAADPDRAASYTFEAADLTVDLSKNLLTSELFRELLARVDAARVAERRDAMFRGDRINVTEDRAVLHTALRLPRDAELVVDGQDVVADVHEVLDRVYAFAERVRSGAWTGVTGERIRTVVNIGIGGSDLGPVMAYEALEPYRQEDLECRFISNIDPTDAATTLKGLDPATTLFIVASKTFGTLETLTNARLCKQWLLDGLTDLGCGRRSVAPSKHFVAVSDGARQGRGVRDRPGQRVRLLGLGRRALLGLDSAIGTSLVVAIGPDRFAEFLAGFARDGRALPHDRARPQRPAADGPAERLVLRLQLGAETHAVLPYAQLLHRFPAYLQQLTMESNGKGVRWDGTAVEGGTGEVFWGEPGTNGQHAFYQLIHQGTRIIPADFIAFANPAYPLTGRRHRRARALPGQLLRPDPGARVRQSRRGPGRGHRRDPGAGVHRQPADDVDHGAGADAVGARPARSRSTSTSPSPRASSGASTASTSGAWSSASSSPRRSPRRSPGTSPSPPSRTPRPSSSSPTTGSTEMPEPRIEVHETAEDLATAVAGELLARVADAQAAGHVPHLGLTGGTIAHKIHRELTRLTEDSETEADWSKVVFWWGDERFVEPASPDRNERQAREAFLDQVDVDPANVHPMPSTESDDSAEAGAAAYGEEMRAHGSGLFEVLMLGVGPDAHVASLFPGHPGVDARDAIAIAVHDSPKPPPDRISLTLECLNRAKAVWFVASGAEKADAVALALAEGTDVHAAPAAGVSGQDETIWFLDRAAASRL